MYCLWKYSTCSAQICKKGLRISVTGYLTLQEYEEGNQKKIIAKCIIEEFEMIDFPEREEMLF